MKKILFSTTLFAAALAAAVSLPSQKRADSGTTIVTPPSLAQPGNYLCNFRYQNTGKEAMSGKFDGLSVNFAPTSEGKWQIVSVALPLKPGMNHIQLYCSGLEQGDLAIDCLDLQPQ